MQIRFLRSTAARCARACSQPNRTWFDTTRRCTVRRHNSSSPACDQEFTNLRSASEHAGKEHCEQVNTLKTEASQKRFSGAGASNTTSGALSHRPLEFRCDNCSRCFRNAGGLRNHNRVCRVPDATRDQLLHSPHASRLAPAASASTVDSEPEVLVDQTQPDPLLVVDTVADSQPQVLDAASQTPPAAPQGDTTVLNYLPSSLPAAFAGSGYFIHFTEYRLTGFEATCSGTYAAAAGRPHLVHCCCPAFLSRWRVASSGTGLRHPTCRAGAQAGPTPNAGPGPQQCRHFHQFERNWRCE